MRRTTRERSHSELESRVARRLAVNEGSLPSREHIDQDVLKVAAGNDAVDRALTGAPLDPQVRADMESRFGADFSQVRVHNDDQAHRSAAGHEAMAYTIGEDVVFGAQRYAPHSLQGRRLLAHELAHVVQQRRGGLVPESAPSQSHEQSAERAAEQVASGAQSVDVQGGTEVGIARAPVPGAMPFDPAAEQRERELQYQAQQRDRLEQNSSALIVSMIALRRRPHQFFKWHARLAALRPGLVYTATHALLGRYGFGVSCKDDYSVDDYLNEFDYAVRVWAAATRYRFISRHALAAPIYDPEEIEHHMSQVILQELPDGTGYIGTRRDFKLAEQEQIKQRNAQTMQNIAGGMGGAIGWGAGGDAGSDLGSTVDTLITGGRTRGGVRGKNVAKPRAPARSGTTARTRGRQVSASRKKVAPSRTSIASVAVTASTASATASTATGSKAAPKIEPLVVVKVQGNNKGSYWREGTAQFSNNAGSTKKDGSPKNPPNRKHVVLPESDAKQLGFREAGQKADYKIEPRTIGGRQVESAGAGRRTDHPITARTARKVGRSTGASLESPKQDKSAQHAFDRTIKADNAQSQGYNALLDKGEYGVLRPNNVSTRGVDAITATIDGQGKVKIFLNDFTTPGTGKPSKPSHRQWRVELREAAKDGRLEFGDSQTNASIRSAIDAGEVYVRTVRVDVPAHATPGARTGAGSAAPILTFDTPVKLKR